MTPLRGQTGIPKATTETMSLASRQATYLQLVFPTTPPSTLAPNQAAPPYSLPEYSAFAFAIYLTSVSHTGRSRGGTLLSFQRSKPSLRKRTLRYRSPYPPQVQPLFEYHHSRPPAGSPKTPSHVGTRRLYPARTSSVTPLASRAVILLPRLRYSIVFY